MRQIQSSLDNINFEDVKVLRNENIAKSKNDFILESSIYSDYENSKYDSKKEGIDIILMTE